MFRTIGKWLIGRAVEQETPLPHWLQRWVDRDEQLSRFEAASRRLGARLRRDAAPWMARQTEHPGQELFAPGDARFVRPRTGSKRRRAAWAAGALAASALFALAWRQGVGDNLPSLPASRGSLGAAQQNVKSISPSEQAQLIAAWRSSRASIRAWHDRLQDASGRFEALHLRNAATFIPSAEIARDTTQHMREAFEATVASKRQDLTAGMKSTYLFFAHRLPASVAILVGLQDG